MFDEVKPECLVLYNITKYVGHKEGLLSPLQSAICTNMSGLTHSGRFVRKEEKHTGFSSSCLPFLQKLLVLLLPYKNLMDVNYRF